MKTTLKFVSHGVILFLNLEFLNLMITFHINLKKRNGTDHKQNHEIQFEKKKKS